MTTPAEQIAADIARNMALPLHHYFAEPHGAFLNFAAATDGLTAEQALQVPREKFNSIWQVVNHVCFWLEASVLLVQESDATPQTPGLQTGGWYAPESATDAEWLALRQQTLDMNKRLSDTIAALDAESLYRVRPPWQQSPFQIAQGMLAHNSYHTAEVISLRHLQGWWVKA
jgi:hypothetical protein